MPDSTSLPYNGTAGFVDRPASRMRAVEEARSGVASARQQEILATLDRMGVRGGTWREVQAVRQTLHHGQISGALSVLHKVGHVFQLRAMRDGCHPYVTVRYRRDYNLVDVFDEPAKTSNGKMKDGIEYAVYLLTLAQAHDDADQLIDKAIRHLTQFIE